MPTEQEQIDAWRRQMDQEEEEEYAEEQRRQDQQEVRNSRSVKFDDLPGGGGAGGGRGGGGGGRVLPAQQQQAARQQPQAGRAQAGAAAPPAMAAPGGQSTQAAAAMQNFDWNAGAMAQLQQFGEQNADLKDALEQKERELANLKRKTELNELTGGIRPPSRSGKGGDVDPRDSKIVELAKKNRSMSLQFEQERSKVGTDRRQGKAPS
eukprot:SAG22_NODE_1527_length_4219_cov_8.734466_3_plen_208_part_00